MSLSGQTRMQVNLATEVRRGFQAVIRFQARSYCNTSKRMRLSEEHIISREICNRSNRMKLTDRSIISTNELRTRKKKRLPEQNATSGEVCNTTKRRKISTKLCRNTSKRRKASHNNVPGKRRKVSSQLCTNTSTTTNWSDLPGELLELIFEKLPVADAIRFSVVCQSWKYAAKSSPLSQRPPMLILPSVDKEQDMSSRPFFSSADNRFYSINKEFPEYEPALSSHGWLLMCKEYSMPYLFNPLSSARIELPELPKVPELRRFTIPDRWRIHKAAISSDPSRHRNFIVVIVLTLWPVTRVVFSKHGDQTWTDLFCEEYATCADIMFTENDLLYVVSNNRIKVWDFRAKSYPSKTMEFGTSGLKIRNKSDMIWTCIVESQGEILFVKRVSRNIKDEFHVYRLNGRQWEEVESLIGCALFLGVNSSTTMSLSTRNFPTFRGNSIYFVELHSAKPYNPMHSKKKPYNPMVMFKILQYNLEDKDVTVCGKFKVKERMFGYPSCLWILPNPGVLHGETEAQIK